MKKCLLILGVLVLVFTTSFSALAGQTVIDSKKTLTEQISLEKSLISTSFILVDSQGFQIDTGSNGPEFYVKTNGAVVDVSHIKGF